MQEKFLKALKRNLDLSFDIFKSKLSQMNGNLKDENSLMNKENFKKQIIKLDKNYVKHKQNLVRMYLGRIKIEEIKKNKGK